MSATLKVTHKAIGVEVRRGTFDVVVDGERVGSLEMNDTIEIPIEAGHHTRQVSMVQYLLPSHRSSSAITTHKRPARTQSTTRHRSKSRCATRALQLTAALEEHLTPVVTEARSVVSTRLFNVQTASRSSHKGCYSGSSSRARTAEPAVIAS